jgi:outer membrane protein assembly factor BamB
VHLPLPVQSIHRLAHRLRRLALLLFAGWLSMAPADAADWPTYRHDNYRSGITADVLPAKKLGVLWTWKSPLAPQPAWAGPAKWDAYAGIRGLKSMRMYDPVFHVIAAQNRVYFGSTVDDSIHCLDAKTGELQWRYTTAGPVRIPPTYNSGRLYFGSDDGYAYCVNAKTGLLKWQFSPRQHASQGSVPPELNHRIVHNGRLIPFWPCRSGLLVQNGTAYFSASLFPWHPSYLCAIDAINGKVAGKGCYVKTLAGQTMEGAMVASDQQLIVPQGRVAPQLFNRATGASLGALKGGGGSFVVLGSDATIFHGPGNKTGWITSSKASDRTAIATYKAGNAILIRGNMSFLLSDTELVASDYLKRKVLWKRDCQHPLELIGVGHTLFAGGTDEVAAYNMSDGKLIWRHPVEGKVFGLSCAGGHLYASTDLGHIYAFTPMDFPRPIAPIAKAPASDTPANLSPIKIIDDPALIGHWAFQRPHVANHVVQDLAGKQNGTIEGNVRLTPIQTQQALVLDGKGNRVIISKNHQETVQPVREITVEAWVRIDQPLTWGGIIGAIQDNGAYERGWLLGYVKSKFSFAIAGKDGPGRMTYLSSTDPFVPGQWYHVAATYDGISQRIYLNGQLSGSSTEQKGNINYPPQAFYEIGAYHDKDENYPAQGMVHEIRVYRRVLAANEILANYRSKILESPPVTELAAGPYLQFIAPDQAVVRWETKLPSPTKLTYGLGTEYQTIRQSALITTHQAILTNLKRHRLYNYSIETVAGGRERSTRQFECDTFFNYQLLPEPVAQNGSSHPIDAVLADVRYQQGLAFVVGVDDGSLVERLARSSRLHVIGFSSDPAKVALCQQRLQRAGLYGSRASVLLVDSLAALPVTRCCANLVTSPASRVASLGAAHFSELHRVLRPGGMVTLAFPVAETASAWKIWLRERKLSFDESQNKGGSLIQAVRPPLTGTGEWSHLYGSPDNSAFGGETLQDVSSTNDLVVQWIGRPGPRYQPDRNGRKPSPLSVNGRLFLQGLQRLLALDAYNGTVLWSLEIPELGRFNMPRDCGNWSADNNFVYVAINDRLWQIDAQTGRVVRQHQLPEGSTSGWEYDWGYIANIGDSILGTSVKKGAAFKSFWGGSSDGWYDAKSGKATAKVCSDQLFSLHKKDGSRRWLYRGGIILNSTITATSKQIYFVESRHPTILASAERRVTDPALWQNNFLVALDLVTGRKLWEQPLKTTPGTVVFYLAHGNGTLALVSSSSKNYAVYAFKDDDGQAVWDTSFPWTKDNHGGHMSRPAIVGNTLYVRPRVFELDSGSHRDLTIPGGGCGTYACTTGALFFRSGNVTVWDRKKGATTKWSRLRPDCWLSTIPAGGMLLSPEGGGGCSCGSWMETSLGFIPKRHSQ